ncbi:MULTISPECIES: hypothetical protein [Bacillus]|uniref:hypothetical protein n=1 Tax=Bacillus TaxID=1386 RepID=UPI00046FB1DC|nr:MULTISPECIES: hypothetical protein [Bacillus subtilis group]MBG9882730.1 hypothetical protein [Bacillus paralicheniformis]MCQ5303197.1 hypothetical protein [Bacillus licheniformis]MEC0777443.1 hypothetical protein [Bacillus licheniformis]MEC1851480.1 hypothetical protein [Bacillus licheniformis]PAC92262.1 hypothetical protein CHH99_12395 [Bacillus licheniformis]
MYEGRNESEDEILFVHLTRFLSEAHNMGGDQGTGKKNAVKLIELLESKGYVIAKVFNKGAMS